MAADINTFDEKEEDFCLKIERNATRINASSVAIERLVEWLEDRLIQIQFGFEIWVSVANEWDDSNNPDVVAVGVSKTRGRWGITLRRSFASAPSRDMTTEEVIFFRDASRRAKLLAAKYLPNLLNEIEAKTKQIAAETERTREAIASLIPKSESPSATGIENDVPITVIRSRERRSVGTGGSS